MRFDIDTVVIHYIDITQSFWMKEKLSTSQTPTRYTDQWTLECCCMGGGFSPSTVDGYGISYMIYGEDVGE